uniref:Uncharacterized protein n=1 Tax=Oryza nivara TaxID=4536 RepID=A0A0E0GD02_ORYNI
MAISPAATTTGTQRREWGDSGGGARARLPDAGVRPHQLHDALRHRPRRHRPSRHFPPHRPQPPPPWCLGGVVATLAADSPQLWFMSIPDGLPDDHAHAMGDIVELLESLGTNGSRVKGEGDKEFSVTLELHARLWKTPSTLVAIAALAWSARWCATKLGVHSIRQSPSRVAQLMERRVGGGGLVMPSAGLQSFTYIALLPVYNRMVVPLARRLAGGGRDSITMLQHVGAGMAIACLTTVVAALVEARRLRVARDTGLVDRPDATVPMDVWWLVPQHVLVGVTEVLAFFYDQLADELHIVKLAVSHGNFISSSHIPAKIKSKMEKMEKMAK